MATRRLNLNHVVQIHVGTRAGFWYVVAVHDDMAKLKGPWRETCACADCSMGLSCTSDLPDWGEQVICIKRKWVWPLETGVWHVYKV